MGKCHIVSKYFLRLTFTVFCLGPVELMAQQESLRMMYPFMPLSINPAEAGSQGILTTTGLFRKKPLIQTLGALTSSQQYFSLDMPLLAESWGLGFMGYNTDQSYASAAGVSSNLGLSVVGAKSFRWGRGNDIRFGANAGLNQYPILGKNGSSEFRMSFGLGIKYQKEDLSMELSAPTISSNPVGGYGAPLYAQAKYVFHLANQNHLKIGFLMRQSSEEGVAVDAHAVFWWAERLGFGLWLQNTGSELGNRALLGSLEVPLGKNFRLGYAYDFLGHYVSTIPAGLSGSSSSSSSTMASGFHQIYIRYSLDVGNGKLAAFRP
jgi:hypothetical protein